MGLLVLNLTPAAGQDTAGNVVWANDNKSLFYVTKDALDRPHKVWRYRLGAADSVGSHDMVFHEVRQILH